MNTVLWEMRGTMIHQMTMDKWIEKICESYSLPWGSIKQLDKKQIKMAVKRVNKEELTRDCYSMTLESELAEFLIKFLRKRLIKLKFLLF